MQLYASVIGLLVGAQIFLVGASAFAQNPTSVPQPAVPNKSADYMVAPSGAEVIREDSSAFNRVDKTFQINAILFGAGPSLSGSTGLQGGLFLNRNMLLFLEATSGKLSSSLSGKEWGSGSESGSSMDVKTRSVGIHFKHYTGNSFYYRAGVDFRNAEYSYVYTSTTTDYYKFKGTSVAANFQIGNQWQWSNFTLGCDWIGISVPLSSKITDEEVSVTAPITYRDWQKSDEDTFVKNTNVNLLRFYLGASF